MLELHQFEIARDEIEPLDIGLADKVAEGPARVNIAERPVKRLFGLHVQLGHRAEEGRERGLRVEINGEHAVATQRQILARCAEVVVLPEAALEVGEGDDLQLLALDAP